MDIGIGGKIVIVILMVLALPYIISFILKMLIALLDDVTSIMRRIAKYMDDYVAHLHTLPEDKKVTVWGFLGFAWKARKGHPNIQ